MNHVLQCVQLLLRRIKKVGTWMNLKNEWLSVLHCVCACMALLTIVLYYLSLGTTQYGQV